MIPRSWSGGAGAVALALAVIGVAVQTVRLDAERASAVRAALVSDSLQAAKDTSREVSLRGMFGDSLRVVERRAVQAEQRSDALDRALGLQRAAVARLSGSVQPLAASVASETVFVTAGNGVRGATFHVREAPYTVHAEVSLPRAPLPGRLAVRVELDTVTLDVRVECGPERRTGVPPASVAVAGPPWASVRLQRVEQSPAVCGGRADEKPGESHGLLRRLTARLGINAGYSAVRLPNGTLTLGASVGAGFRIWP